MGASTLPLLMALKRRGYIAERLRRDRNRRPAARRFVPRREERHCGDRPFLRRHHPTAVVCLDRPPQRHQVLAGAPLAREFWTWLGLSYASIDIDGSPGSIPLDLNYDEVPAAFVGQYDVVTNFGTTEHVANQLQSFKIIHDLATPGALMLHVLPASGTPEPRPGVLQSKILLDARPQQRLQDRLHDHGPVRARCRLAG